MLRELDWSAVTEEAIGVLGDLIRIDTTNPPGNERAAAELLARILDREGIDYTILESAPGRANLVARLRGSGVGGPLLLNGHLDVVPAERARWQRDPFGGELADGCIWGRGAIDMKNMVTMNLMALVLLKRRGIPLQRDVIFAAVADEEAGSRHGSLFLVEQHPELVRAEYVLNEVGGHTLHMGQARLYPVQIAEKGICWFELSAEGPPGHGSLPKPDSAIVKLSRAVQLLAQRRLRQRPTPVVEQFIRTLARHAPFAQGRLLALLLEPRLSSKLLDLMDERFPEQAAALNAMLRNTATVTELHAGYKVNVVPSSALARVDGRVIPGVPSAEFLDEVRRVVGPDVALRVLDQHDGVSFRAETSLFETIREVVQRHDPGAFVVPYMIPGFTDAFAYARLGATCYGFSPVKLGPELVFSRLYHGHDERIPVEGFAWGLRVLIEVVTAFCAEGDRARAA